MPQDVADMKLSMLNTLKLEGFHNVAALLDGQTPPGLINGAQPDLVAFNSSGKGVVVQVETCATLKTLAAEERIASLVMVMAEGHEFRLLVPTECLSEAVEWVRKLGLDEEVVWEYFQ